MTAMVLALLALAGLQPEAAASRSDVLASRYSATELELSTDPTSPVWAAAPRVVADRNYVSEPIAGPPTEIRSRWTTTHLYLLYICPYDTLNLKPGPDRTAETPKLWNWDVAEAFIGSDQGPVTRYREYQVSPQGEWVDLDIDRENPRGQAGGAWNSGFTVAARIDAQQKVWYGVMRIPFASIDERPAAAGRRFRAGLYRIAGVGDAKQYYAWRPTGQKSFHVPEAFGAIRLE
jgi:hypothetical protein